MKMGHSEQETAHSGARMRLLAIALAALGAAGLVTVACGGGVTSPGSVGSTNLRLMLTDDPIDDVEEVFIYFTSVTAKAAGEGPPQQLPLQLETNPIDLLTLADEVTSFAAGTVEPGAYEFIHINIDPSQSYIVENGEQKSLLVPSGEIKILDGFTVGEDNVTTLTLDFDAKASLVALGNGGWLLKPIVVITGNNSSSEP